MHFRTLGNPFAGLVIRSILVCYAVWGSVVVADLVNCEARRPGTCEPQRSEMRGAAAAIPATLLAWLAESPVGPGSVFGKKPGRTIKLPQDEATS